ncbi:MAG: helix-turn-helix domain-containing protein [Clostridium butyricum]
MDIGKKIKHYRQLNKMTQKNLANSINKSIETIKKYENGNINPPIDVLKNIAESLGVNIFDFMNADFKEYESYCDDDKNHIYKLLNESNIVERILEYLGYSIESYKNDNDFLEYYLSLNDGRKIELHVDDITNIKDAIENAVNFEIQRILKRGWING